MTLYAIILESPSEFGDTPELIVAETHDGATQALIRCLAELDKNLTGGLEQHIQTYESWLPTHPIPDVSNPDGRTEGDCEVWLEDLHEVLSDFWWTRYTINDTTVELAS